MPHATAMTIGRALRTTTLTDPMGTVIGASPDRGSMTMVTGGFACRYSPTHRGRARSLRCLDPPPLPPVPDATLTRMAAGVLASCGQIREAARHA